MDNELSDKQRYLYALESMAGSYNGLREFKDLRNEDYLGIGTAYMMIIDYMDLLEYCTEYHNELSLTCIAALNNISKGEDKTDNLEEMLKTYQYFLIEFIKNNREVEFDYDQAKVEAYAEFKRNPSPDGDE